MVRSVEERESFLKSCSCLLFAFFQFFKYTFTESSRPATTRCEGFFLGPREKKHKKSTCFYVYVYLHIYVHIYVCIYIAEDFSFSFFFFWDYRVNTYFYVHLVTAPSSPVLYSFSGSTFSLCSCSFYRLFRLYSTSPCALLLRFTGYRERNQ